MGTVRPTIALCTLLLYLATEPDTPRSGLEIVRATGLGTGTVYPTLIRLRKGGLVTSWWEQGPQPTRPHRQLHRLTAAGRSFAHRVDADDADSLFGVANRAEASAATVANIENVAERSALAVELARRYRAIAASLMDVREAARDGLNLRGDRSRPVGTGPPRLGPEGTDRVVRVYSGGASIREIAAAEGVAYGTIHRALEAKGVLRRWGGGTRKRSKSG